MQIAGPSEIVASRAHIAPVAERLVSSVPLEGREALTGRKQ